MWMWLTVTATALSIGFLGIDLEEFRRKLKTAKKLGTTCTTSGRATYDAYIEAIRLFHGRQPLWAVARLWNLERDAIPV